MVAEIASSPDPRSRKLLGHAKPRLGPPVPLRSDLREIRDLAVEMGMPLIPWQETVCRYVTARKADGTHLYREVADVVSRQNGKTTIPKPLIVKWLKDGRRILHIADKRELPRDMHSFVADWLMAHDPELFPKRRGKPIWPRFGAGQEEIELANGGRYRIATTKGGRGWPADILIIDELREMEDFTVISAAGPTQMASPDPFTWYLSNAGTDKSVVLNSVRDRAGKDPNLAYLEWSAPPDFDAGDKRGWVYANPSIGHIPGLLAELERAYQRHLLAGTMPIFETEHLCRWVPTLQPRVIADVEWQKARGPMVEPVSPVMAIKVDPEGRRASAVIAWTHDNLVYLRSFAEDVMAPVDLDAFAADLLPLSRKFKVRQIGYDPWTDRDLARHFPTAKAINGADYYQAGERFVRSVTGGQLRHDDDGTIGSDLAYTVRRETPNGWFATRSDAERPTTAGEAAIRAVWLATTPAPGRPRVY